MRATPIAPPSAPRAMAQTQAQIQAQTQCPRDWGEGGRGAYRSPRMGYEQFPAARYDPVHGTRGGGNGAYGGGGRRY